MERAQQSQEEKWGPCEQCGVSIRPQRLMIFWNSNNNTLRQGRFWGEMTCKCHPARQRVGNSSRNPRPASVPPFGELQHPAYAVRTCLVYKQVLGKAWEYLPTRTWRYTWLGTAGTPRSRPTWLFLLQISTFNSSPTWINTAAEWPAEQGTTAPCTNGTEQHCERTFLFHKTAETQVHLKINLFLLYLH